MKTVILVVSLLANVFLGGLLLLESGDLGMEQDYIACLELRLVAFVEGDTVEANSFICGDTV
jgi:hypothetical protein